MSIADRPHGRRARYNAGCRCGACRQANREHSRRRRSNRITAVPAAPAEVSPPAEFLDGRVTEAVRAELAHTTAAQDRPGLYAIAIRLAQLLDRDDAVPQFSAAAHRLTEILTTLAKSANRRGRLAAVRSMTAPNVESLVVVVVESV